MVGPGVLTCILSFSQTHQDPYHGLSTQTSMPNFLQKYAIAIERTGPPLRHEPTRQPSDYPLHLREVCGIFAQTRKNPVWKNSETTVTIPQPASVETCSMTSRTVPPLVVSHVLSVESRPASYRKFLTALFASSVCWKVSVICSAILCRFPPVSPTVSKFQHCSDASAMKHLCHRTVASSVQVSVVEHANEDDPVWNHLRRKIPRRFCGKMLTTNGDGIFLSTNFVMAPTSYLAMFDLVS